MFRPELILGLLIVSLSGCVTDDRLTIGASQNKPVSSTLEVNSGVSNSNPHLIRLANSVEAGGQRNFVLTSNRLALVQFQLGEFEDAKKNLTASAQIVNNFYNDDVWSKKAQETFTSDSIKDFKGDAYERSMLFYYLGLSEIGNGLLDNARAAFKNGLLQDSFAENEKYRADFFLMPTLEAWALICEGRTLDAIEKASSLPEALSGLIIDSDEKQYFTIVESGKAPQKETAGRYSNILVYRNISDNVEAYSFNTDGKQELLLGGDVLYQAKTRGGRIVDAVVDGKVKFRKGAESMSNAMLGTAQVTAIAAADLALQGEDDAAVAAAAIAGVAIAAAIVSDVAASSTATKADTRYWDNLPNKVFLGASNNSHSVVYDSRQNILQLTKIFENDRCQISWGRDVPTWSVPTDAPNWGVYK